MKRNSLIILYSRSSGRFPHRLGVIFFFQIFSKWAADCIKSLGSRAIKELETSVDSKWADTMQKQLVHKPGTGPIHTQVGWSERAQGGTVQGGVPVTALPAPSPTDSLDPRDELKGRRRREQLGAHGQHRCTFRVKFCRRQLFISVTGYEVFITIAVTLTSNIVPIGTRAFAPLPKWSFIQSSKKIILSIPPTPSKEREKREREKKPDTTE